MAAMVFKAILATLLWSLVLRTFFVGPLPSSFPFQFRAPACVSKTKVVVWFFAIDPASGKRGRDAAVLIVYVRGTNDSVEKLS